jgi:hypothetical protein
LLGVGAPESLSAHALTAATVHAALRTCVFPVPFSPTITFSPGANWDSASANTVRFFTIKRVSIHASSVAWYIQ